MNNKVQKINVLNFDYKFAPHQLNIYVKLFKNFYFYNLYKNKFYIFYKISKD